MGLFESITVRIGADLSAFRTAMGEVAAGPKSLADKFGATFGNLKRDIIQTGVAISATLGLASTLSLKAAADYEQGLAQINTLLKLNAQDLAVLGQGQRNLAKEFGVGIVDQMKGLYDALSSGVTDAAHATEYMRTVNQAAVGGMTDVRVVGEAMIRMLLAYRKEGLSAADASDILFRTVDKGIVEMAQLAPIIGNVAGVAAASGIQVKEMAAALATLTLTSGPEEAATRLIALLQAFAKPTEEATKVAGHLGVRLDSVALSTRGLQVIMAQLAAAIGADAVKQLQEMIRTGSDGTAVLNQMAAAAGITTQDLSALFPNIRALQGALSLMSNDGKNFETNLKAMGAASGATGEAFTIMNDTSSQGFKKLKAEVHDLEISIGEAMLPTAKRLGEELSKVLVSVNEWITKNPELTGQLADWAVKASAIAVVMAPLGIILTGVSSAFGVLFNVLKLGVISVQLLTTAFAFLAANPLVALGIAIGALVVLFATHWPETVALMEDAVEGLKELAKKLYDWAIKPIVDGFKWLWEKIGEAWDGIVEWTGNALDWIGELFSDGWEYVKGIPGAVFDWISDKAGAFWGWIVDKWRSGGQLLSAAWEYTWNGIKDFFSGIGDWIREKWEGLVGWIRGVLDWIGTAASNIGNFFSNTVPGAMGFAEGGYVSGRAGVDMIPARLSDGEFVVNRQATAENRALLEALNSGALSSAGGQSYSTTVHGGMQFNFPNVRSADDARAFAEEYDRLLSKKVQAGNRRGLR